MFYFLTYPSVWGMGSNADVFLVTEDNLKKLIEEELKKKEKGLNYSKNYTGKWSYADFCRGKSEEIVQDIIQERLHTCHTYAGHNDLIRLPKEVPVIEKREHMTDTIFRVFNQWGYKRDVIVHDAEFVRYMLDMKGHEVLTRLRGGARYLGFTGFDFKNIMMSFSMDSMEKTDLVIAMLKEKIKRVQNKIAGREVPSQGYISDYLEPEDKLLQKMTKDMEADKKTIAHLEEKMPLLEDDYYQHLYQDDYGPFEKEFEKSIEEDNRDHTKYTYKVILDNTFGCIYSGYEESERPHRFDEIFQGECSLKYLLCSLTEIGDDKKFGKINVLHTLTSVFGYD